MCKVLGKLLTSILELDISFAEAEADKVCWSSVRHIEGADRERCHARLLCDAIAEINVRLSLICQFAADEREHSVKAGTHVSHQHEGL